MGNSSSSDQAAKRPPLKSTLSSSSTTTLKASASQKRRKSIELPDLQHGVPTLQPLTPTTSPLDLKGKGKALPPAATQVYHDGQHRAASSGVDEILLGSNASDLHGTALPSPVAAVDEPGELDITQGKDLGATLDEAIQKHMASDRTPLASPVALGAEHPPIPLPFEFSTPTDSPFASLPPSLEPDLSALPPLDPPTDTVVAPLIPAAVPLPLGTAASATASLIMGSPRESATSSPLAGTPTVSSAALDHPFNVSESLVSAMQRSTAVSEFSSSSGGASSHPLPAAAPLVALTGSLSNDPAAAEAVKAATVDLGAGAEGVPTLLTWTPGEGEGKEGGMKEGEAGPSKVYVTGTFAKDWTTKIELRKKKSVALFFAC
jgi:hypothetical protein